MSHLFAGRRWVLETTLTEEECASRLKSKLRGMWETKWNPDKPLYGSVTSSGFAVQITTTLGANSAYNPYFIRGVFTRSAAGTTIRAKYGVLTTVRLFVAGMASFFLFMVWRVVPHFNALPVGLTLFFVSALLFLLHYTYSGVRFMNRSADFDRELILDAVAEILEARISETPDGLIRA